ncbi:MAG: CheR family methyltransferase [Mycobacteriales bacterium]
MKLQLSDAEFDRVRTMLARQAGLVFDDSRRNSLQYSLGERLAAAKAHSVDDYLALLDAPAGAVEMQALLNAVTIQETHFFRNPPQFRALRQHVLPELLRLAVASGSRKLRVWSAGCSTGEEPYSVAMLLRGLLPLIEGWDLKVVATDISTHALEAARRGRYSARALNLSAAEETARWFVRDGADYVVRPEIRELVEFRHHNLVTDAPPFEPGETCQLILCRNVTIYFSRETTRELIVRLHGCLSDGGYLFLGHSETLWQVNEDFRLVTLGEAFVYRRDPPREPGRDERRVVLPDRRTKDEGPPAGTERRAPRAERRSTAWEVLTKPRALPFQRPPREPTRAEPATAPPSLAEVHDALAQGAYDDAAARAAEIMSAEPLRAEAYYLRGVALTNLGRDGDALDVLRKAVYIDPGSGFAHFVLAGVLGRLGDPDAAARTYRAAAESLSRAGTDHDASELGGRSVAELVALCRQLGGA